MTSVQSSRLRATVERFLRQSRSAQAVQQGLLAAMLRRNADTEFGKEHGFRGIDSVRDYQRQVPIRQWADMIPYVESVIEGRPGILTKEPPFFFQRTTGTTGTPKMIPFTRRCQQAARHMHRLWCDLAARDNPGLFGGRTMAILNAGIDGYTARGQAYGSVSGNVFFRMPLAARRTYCHPYDVYHIKDVEARRYTLLRFAVHHDCSFAFTGNPSSLLALFELADRQADSLIKDIHDGTLDSRFDVPEPIRMVALNDLLPDPGRARALARARERAGRLMPADYWPDLKVLGCWIGGSMGHFAPLLRQWCGERFRFRDVGYMASEGVFTVPFANDAADGLMALDSIFFEFLPEQDFGRRDITPLLAHEIEPGRNYHVIITTTGGLYRYAMNDVVRAGSSEWGVPTLRFLYKGNHVQNLQGEMVTVDHVMSAMSSLCEGHGIRLHHFQIVADLDRRRYLLHVEPIDRLARPLLTRLLLDFDGELGKANENYAMFRADGLIGAPSLRVMRQGWFDRILQDHVARSGRDSQFKPAVLASAAEHGEMAELSIDWPPDGLREHVFPQRLASRRQ